MAATTVKKGELKNLIKECVLEMIKDGSFKEVFMAATNQSIQGVAAGVAPSEKSLMELALADTIANEAPKHLNNMMFSNGMTQPMMPQQMMMPQQQMMMPQQMMMQPGIVNVPQLNQQPQQFWNNGFGQQQQQPMMPQQQQPINKWAALAFNSPIKNRPNSESSMLAGMGGGEGFLPGQGRGQFG